MVYLVCVESGSNLTVLNIRLVSEKSMIAQLISKKAGKWLEYEIGESPRKETALNPKHCIDIPYHILHTMRNYLLSILKGFQPIVTLREIFSPPQCYDRYTLPPDRLLIRMLVLKLPLTASRMRAGASLTNSG